MGELVTYRRRIDDRPGEACARAKQDPTSPARHNEQHTRHRRYDKNSNIVKKNNILWNWKLQLGERTLMSNAQK